MQISKSLRIFLDKIIDYAGLFPPAKLPLEESYKNFLIYKSEDLNWMLSNFICPVNKLKELNDLMRRSAGPADFILPLSLIIKNSELSEEFLNGIKEELKLVNDFLLQDTGKVKINSFELKLPSVVMNSSKEKVTDILNRISIETRHSLNRDVFFFYEAVPGDEWEKNADNLISAISDHNEKFPDSGFKLRTGGVNSSDFPSPEQVAYAIRKCLDKSISFKATAGLHHPVRHFDKSVKAKMHGFLNLFGAASVAHRHNITDHELVKMLEEEDPDQFKFTDEAFSYKGWEVTNDEIGLARKEFAISYGSCSFNEPVEDLQKLRLI